MLKLITFLFIWGSSVYGVGLKGGDLILQPLKCYTCQVIAAQTSSAFSHIGIVVIKNKQVFVAQAWGKVKLTPFADFMAQGTGEHLILRSSQKIDNTQLLTDFENNFEDLPYDRNFLWGDNAIYCSELVYKLLAMQNIDMPTPRPMQFDVHRNFWIRYFRGSPPDGELGNSPADFERSTFFKKVGQNEIYYQ